MLFRKFGSKDLHLSSIQIKKKISARETKVHFTEKREENRGRRREYGRPRQEVGSKEGRGGRQKGEGLTKYCIKGVG